MPLVICSLRDVSAELRQLQVRCGSMPIFPGTKRPDVVRHCLRTFPHGRAFPLDATIPTSSVPV